MPRAVIVLGLVLGLTLSGCGFQLRGTFGVPEAIQPLALKCAPPVPDRICSAVENQLELANVSLTDVSEAAAVLELSDFRQDRRANAVTARAGAAEYTLRQTIELDVVSSGKTPLIASQSVTSAETYRYDETNVLAKQQEEEAIEEALSQRLAQQILFRLAPLNQTRVDTLEAAK